MTVLLDRIGQDLPVLGLVFIILLFVAFGTERFPPVTVLYPSVPIRTEL